MRPVALTLLAVTRPGCHRSRLGKRQLDQPHDVPAMRSARTRARPTSRPSASRTTTRARSSSVSHCRTARRCARTCGSRSISMRTTTPQRASLPTAWTTACSTTSTSTATRCSGCCCGKSVCSSRRDEDAAPLRRRPDIHDRPVRARRHAPLPLLRRRDGRRRLRPGGEHVRPHERTRRRGARCARPPGLTR